MTIYTIGHSHVPIERFLELLALHHIETVIDVRSQPHSRFAPQFNRPTVAASLARVGITYHHFGETLGGRPQDPRYHRPDGTVDYGLMAQAPQVRQALRDLQGAAERSRLATMCAEADFHHCHRYWLIARALVREGVKVIHIMPDGTLIETSEEAFASIPEQLRLL